ncbi:hypothetical protein D3C83_48100 [compost metagenome]
MPLENRLGERVFDLRLDRPFQRPRAVDRIEPCCRDFLERGVAHLEPHLERCQPLLEKAHLNACDRLDVLLVERVEYHDFVDAIDEFGTELRLDLGQHRELDHLVVITRHLLDLL